MGYASGRSTVNGGDMYSESKKGIRCMVGFFLVTVVVLIATVAQGRVISGTLQRPDSIDDSVAVEAEISIFGRNQPDIPIYTHFVTLPAGQNSVPFSLVDTTAEMIGLRYALWSTSQTLPILDYGYYNSNGTQVKYQWYDAFHLPAGTTDISGKLLTLLPAIFVSGSIGLPAGVTDAESGTVVITPKWSWGCDDPFNAINNTSFSVDISAPRMDYSVKAPGNGQTFCIGYNSFGTSYFPHGFIGGEGDTVPMDNRGAAFTGTSDLTEKNLTLIQASPISGTISLPASLISDTSVTLWVYEYNAGSGCDRYGYLNSDYLNLSGATPSESFSIPVPLEGDWCLGYSIYDSANYVSNGYIAENNTTSALLNNAISLSAGTGGHQLQILQGKTFSGTLSLPDGEVANSYLNPSVMIYSSPDGLCQTWDTASLKGMAEPFAMGESSTTWSIVVPVDEIPQFCLSYSIYGGSYWNRGFYAAGGSTRSTEGYGLVMNSADADPGAVLTLIPARSVTGTISRNPEDPGTSQLDFVIWNWWGGSYAQGYYHTLYPGVTSMTYNRTFPVDIDYLTVGYAFPHGSTPPEGFAPEGWYSSATQTVAEHNAATQLPVTSDHTNIHLQFLYGPVMVDTLGDVNNDGTVDLIDLVILLQSMTNTSNSSSYYLPADVDGDGKLGMAEALYVMNELIQSPYYEVYGAMAGDYNLNTSHTLIGTSEDGNTFDMTGYDRFIIHVPAYSGPVQLDALGLGSGWVDSGPLAEYTHYSANFAPPDGDWIDDSYIEGQPDGRFIINNEAENAYYSFTMDGVTTLTVYLAE